MNIKKEKLIEKLEKVKAKKGYYESRLAVSKQIIESENSEASLVELEEIAKEKLLKKKLGKQIEKINKELQYLQSSIIQSVL